MQCRVEGGGWVKNPAWFDGVLFNFFKDHVSNLAGIQMAVGRVMRTVRHVVPACPRRRRWGRLAAVSPLIVLLTVSERAPRTEELLALQCHNRHSPYVSRPGSANQCYCCCLLFCFKERSAPRPVFVVVLFVYCVVLQVKPPQKRTDKPPPKQIVTVVWRRKGNVPTTRTHHQFSLFTSTDLLPPVCRENRTDVSPDNKTTLLISFFHTPHHSLISSIVSIPTYYQQTMHQPSLFLALPPSSSPFRPFSSFLRYYLRRPVATAPLMLLLNAGPYRNGR